jgi:hypothetical protein
VFIVGQTEKGFHQNKIQNHFRRQMDSSFHRFVELLKRLKKVHSVICNETLITDKQMNEKNDQTFSMYHNELLG